VYIVLAYLSLSVKEVKVN